MFSLEHAQKFMANSGIDAWIAYDFRGSNPVFWHLMGGTRSTTRRAFLIVPKAGQPTLLVHAVDRDAFTVFEGSKTYFHNWRQMQELLRTLVGNGRRVAMEYSPNGSIPTMSWADAGTIELLRGWGLEIVSSADLFQESAAFWDDHAVGSHVQACPVVASIKDSAFEYIGKSLREGRTVTEYDVSKLIMEHFSSAGLETEDAPIVAVNANSGDPHYEPSAARSSIIKNGDWILIDLWARYPGEKNVFSDITWVAFAGIEPPKLHQAVFEIVRKARDAAIDTLVAAWNGNRTLMGYEVDAVAREVITTAGYGDHFVHRTGHSIAPGQRLHGLGVNIDDFETRDTRQIRPGVGFSIEPGIYLPDFGVRLEVNAFIDPKKGPTVTTPIQREIVLL